MAYKFQNTTLYGLRPHDIQILCGCGRPSNYMIHHNTEGNPSAMTLFCDACGHFGKPEALTEFIPNPNAPWRQ